MSTPVKVRAADAAASGELEVVPYAPEWRAAWDEAVRGARASHFFFERGYLEYHADRFTDASLLVLHKGRVLAVLPASRHGDEVRSHGGLTFGGLLSGPALTAARCVEALAAIAEHLAAAGAKRLVYKPAPHIYHRAPAEEDLFALTALGARLVQRDVSQAIARGARPKPSEERRRAAKRGAKAGLVLARSRDLEEFMALQERVLARHGVAPVHTAAELELLTERFPEGLELWTARNADGVLLAGTLLFVTPTVAHAQYIASSDEGRACGAPDHLFEHLIGEVHAERPFFDFGISSEAGEVLNLGLARNKEGHGGRAVVYDRYELDL